MMYRTVFAIFLMIFAVSLSGTAHAQYNAFQDPSTVSSSGGISGPELDAVKDRVDGGKITVGVTTNVLVLFKNTGTAPVEIKEVKLYPSSTVSATLSLNQCGNTLVPPGAECAMTVAVAGLQAGAWRVEMLVSHDGRTRLATAAGRRHC